MWVISGHLGNNEDPGQADCHEKSTAHSEGSTEEAEAEKSKCFWKTLNMQPNKNLETLENGNEFGQTASPGYVLKLYNYTLPPADAPTFMELFQHYYFVCRQIF